MAMIGHPGLGLLVALMIARGGAPEAPPAAVLTAAPAAGPSNAQTSDDAAPAIGAFRRLPTEDQRIARAFLEAERVGPGTGPAWSLDRIAAARLAGKDWKRIAADMQVRGLIASGDLKAILIERGPEAEPPRTDRIRSLGEIVATRGVSDTGKASPAGPPESRKTTVAQADAEAAKTSAKGEHAQDQAPGCSTAGKGAPKAGTPAGSR